MGSARDLTGFVNEYFKVIEFHGIKRNRRWWKCECKCGKIVVLPVDEITRGHTKSCGCAREPQYFKKGNTVGKLNIKHGFAIDYKKDPIYKLWIRIKRRCYTASPHDFPYYQGKGIKMCDEWKNSIICFYEWCNANGYKIGLTIDRVDPNGHYEPSNCRFITFDENRARIDRSNFTYSRSKLSNDQVLEIKSRLAAETDSQIARDYDISKKTINMIRNNKIWKHITCNGNI